MTDAEPGRSGGGQQGPRRLRDRWSPRAGNSRDGADEIMARAAAGLRRLSDALRLQGAPRPAPPGSLGRGLLLAGTVWPGGDAEPFEGVVVLDGQGIVRRVGPAASGVVADLPSDVPMLGGPGHWIGPGIVDAHVHLAFSSLGQCLSRGVVAVRDLGAPPALARRWRTGHRQPPEGHPVVAVAGPVLTAPHGYPSRTWGRDGYTLAIASAGHARQAVHRVAADGADVVKIALESGDGRWPVPGPTAVRAVVDASHAAGLAVVAHALSADMVRRAVNAGVDELAHTPTERLPGALVDRIADAGISVMSTLQTFFSAGSGRAAAANAAALHRAGVLLRYGTDLGNAGTWPGVDPRELDRLADAGLGRLGALRAATVHSARAAGIRGRSGMLRVGESAALVVLPADPLAEPGAWRAPSAVVADGRLILG